MNERRTLVSNALFSTAQVVVLAAVLLELYRFLTRQLSIAEIGIWSLVMASTAIGRLTDFGLGGGVVRFVAADLGQGERDRAARTIWMSGISVALLIACACIVIYPVLWRVLAGFIESQDALLAARALLPYALVCLWVSSVANVALSALDGFQRIDLRAMVTIGAALAQLLCAYVAVPRLGLEGLALTQLTQVIAMLVCGSVLVWRQMKRPLACWMQWEGTRFRELVRYGGGLQVAAVGQLLVEPSAKALITKFGGLAMTGYYDMASRMIIQLRAIVMAAFQALVPYVSSARLDPAEVRRLYLASYRLLVFLAVAYYTAAAVALPIMLSLWLGRIEPDFIIIALFVLAGWSVNTLVGPAYYVYVATGRLRWTVISHLCIGVGTLVLGLIGGLLFGGFGAVAGVTLALAAGSSVVTVAFHKDFGIGLRELLPRESIAMVGACIGAAAILLVICGAFASDVQAMVAFVVAPLIQGLVVAVVSWRNPNRERLFSMLGQVFSSRAA